MLIKQTALPGLINKTLNPIYVLIGTDDYLLNETATHIKSTWQKKHNSEEKRLALNQAADWNMLLEEAQSYSLFFDALLIDATMEKKSLAAEGKAVLDHYLKSINPLCLMLIRAPLLTTKPLQWLSRHPQVTVVHITSLTAPALIQWISQQLHQFGLQHTPEIPPLMYQYTQGNQQATAQLLEKLSLTHAPGTSLTQKDVTVHLVDQCDYPLYELPKACLAGDVTKAILLARFAQKTNIDVVQILWLITHEIRLLLQIHYQLKQGIQLTQACNQLKIWSQQIKHYETAQKRLSTTRLHALLHMSQQLDEGLKTGKNTHIWQGIEQLILQLSSTTMIC